MPRSRVDVAPADARYLERAAAAERVARIRAQARRENLADALRTLHEESGYSVRALAAVVDLSPAHVYRLIQEATL